jgi:uncharacterized membrane protein
LVRALDAKGAFQEPASDKIKNKDKPLIQVSPRVMNVLILAFVGAVGSAAGMWWWSTYGPDKTPATAPATTLPAAGRDPVKDAARDAARDVLKDMAKDAKVPKAATP